MEYKVIKPFSCEAVYQAGMEGEDLDTFMAKWFDGGYGFGADIPDDKILEYIYGNCCAEEWAIDHGFIKAKEPTAITQVQVSECDQGWDILIGNETHKTLLPKAMTIYRDGTFKRIPIRMDGVDTEFERITFHD